MSINAVGRWRRRLCIGVLAFAPILAGCGDGLEEYVSEEGGFRVRMPGQPKPDRDPALPRGIKKVTLLQRSGSYEVAWQDVEAEKDLGPEERLDRACDGALRALKAKEIRRTPITMDQRHSGRELVAEWPGGKGIVHDRMYLVEGRLYQVVVSGPKWWVESTTSRKVLESFALIER